MAEAAGTVFFQRIVSPTFFDTPTDEEKVSKALEEDLPPALAYLEGQITGGPGSSPAVFRSPTSRCVRR